jgi:hypothetical protein
MAAQHLLPHRGEQFAAGAALHLVATAAWLWLCAAVVSGRRRPGAATALALCVTLSAVAFGLPPQLSDDVYRYVWEGRVVLAGHNPYVTPPSAEVLAPLRDACWERVSNKDVPAVYPPAVQACLALAAAISPQPASVKALFGGLHVLAFALLWRALPSLGRPREWAVLYGWCPLLAVEFAGEGHSDSLAVAATVAAIWASARGRPAVAGAALAVATAAKLLPAALLPFVARRGWRALPAFALVLAVLYAPFWAPPRDLLAATAEYAARWRSNDSAFAVVYWATERLMSPWWTGEGYSGPFAGAEVQRVAKVPLVLIGAAVLARCWRRRASPERAGRALFLLFLALSPTVHPWYVALAVPFLCVTPNLLLLAFTGTVYLAYHVLPEWLRAGVWRENGWVKAAEYLPFYVGLAMELRRRAPAPGGAASEGGEGAAPVARGSR